MTEKVTETPAAPRPRARWKSALRLLPLLFLGVILWREKPWASGFPRVSPWAVLGVIALNFGIYLPLKAARWRLALHDPPSFWKVFAAQLEGLLANAAIGLGSGDVVRAARLRGQAAEGHFARDYGASLAERGAEFLALAVLILVGAIAFDMGRVALALAAACVVGYVVVLAAGRTILPRLTRWPRVHTGLAAALASSTRRQVIGMTLLSLAGWASEVIMLQIFLRAFALRADFGTALFILVGINAAIIVPGPPGNFGTFEAGAVMAMTLRGIPRDAAVLFALAFHLVHVVPVAVIGTLVYGLRSRKTSPPTRQN